MFGKLDTIEYLGTSYDNKEGFNPRVRGTCLVSSTLVEAMELFVPCAVSIPVCGEHVW